MDEGTWLWEQSGQPFTFTRWIPGEPSNDFGHGHFMEIVVTSNGDIRWNDMRDSFERAVVCEITF